MRLLIARFVVVVIVIGFIVFTGLALTWGMMQWLDWWVKQ